MLLTDFIMEKGLGIDTQPKLMCPSILFEAQIIKCSNWFELQGALYGYSDGNLKDSNSSKPRSRVVC